MFCWKNCLSARVAADEINDIVGQESISNSQAAEWICRFKEGDISLEDKSRCGRPRTLNDEVCASRKRNIQGLVLDVYCLSLGLQRTQ